MELVGYLTAIALIELDMKKQLFFGKSFSGRTGLAILQMIGIVAVIYELFS